MKKPDATALLKEMILIKEAGNKLEGKLLRAHFYLVYESLKPVNLIKDIVKGLFSSEEVKTGVVDNVMGLTGGFIAKKILIGSTPGVISKVIGFATEMIVASNIVNNADEIKAVANVLIRKIIPKYGQTEVS